MGLEFPGMLERFFNFAKIDCNIDDDATIILGVGRKGKRRINRLKEHLEDQLALASDINVLDVYPDYESIKGFSSIPYMPLKADGSLNGLNETSRSDIFRKIIECNRPTIHAIAITNPDHLKLVSFPAVEVDKVVNREIIQDINNNPDRLNKMSGRDFEFLIAELYKGIGYNALCTKGSDDGGADLILYKNFNGMRHSYAVQCKHIKNKKISTGLIRELLGTINNLRVTAGIFVTSSTFSKKALKLIKKMGDKIHKIDFKGLMELIRSYLRVTAYRMFGLPVCPECN